VKQLCDDVEGKYLRRCCICAALGQNGRHWNFVTAIAPAVNINGADSPSADPQIPAARL